MYNISANAAQPSDMEGKAKEIICQAISHHWAYLVGLNMKHYLQNSIANAARPSNIERKVKKGFSSNVRSFDLS